MGDNSLPVVRAAQMLAPSPETVAAVAEALAGSTIRVEEGVRLTWTAGDDREGKHGDDQWDGYRPGLARQVLAWHLDEIAKQPGWRVRPTLVTRLIITTKAEEMTDV